MNYQHSYHAGSIADVFKHIVVIQLLKFLQKKPGALSYIESHAGDALYDLQANPSQKTLEYKDGIAKLWPPKPEYSSEINDYLEVVASINPDQTLHFYPGSGLFAEHYLREEDEAILCELHPKVYENLRHYFNRDKHIHVHERNGYEALTALLPPKTKRGLVLIDPPYEATNEYEHIINTLTTLETRWLNGVYAIWYPIKEYQDVLTFYHQLKRLSFKNILAAECWSKPNAENNRIKGSGLVIINPPWQFDKELQKLLLTLPKSLSIEAQGKTQLLWLVKES